MGSYGSNTPTERGKQMNKIFEKTDRSELNEIGVGDKIIVGYETWGSHTKINFLSPQDCGVTLNRSGVGIGTILTIEKTQGPRGGDYLKITVGGVPDTHILPNWTTVSICRSDYFTH